MPLGQAELHHISLLARLQLSPQEESEFAAQLEQILEAFEKLQQIPTDGVEPTAHIVEMETPFRDDVVRNVPAVDALLRNAPERDGAFFKVPKIIE